MSEDDLSQFLSGLSNPQNRFAQLGLLEFIEGPDSYSVSEATILEWVRDDPGLPPLMTFCSSECSNAVDACLISGARALTFSSGFPHPWPALHNRWFRIKSTGEWTICARPHVVA